MADSIREQVVAAFAARINAQRCQQLDGNSDLPARAVWDTTETVTRAKYRKLTATVDLNVGYMAPVDRTKNQSVQGNAMLAELINDALTEDPTLGGLCKQIDYLESVIDYAEPGQNEIAILAGFQIVYEISNTDPFSQ